MSSLLQKALYSQGWKKMPIESTAKEVGDEVLVPAGEINGSLLHEFSGVIEKINRDSGDFRLDGGLWVNLASRSGQEIFIAPRQYLTIQSMMAQPGREATDQEGRTYFYMDGKLIYYNSALKSWYSKSAASHQDNRPLTALKLHWKK